MLDGMDEKPGKPFQISLRTLMEVVAVAAFVLALLYSRRDPGNGRYQLLDRGGEQSRLILLDTRTGECWTGYEDYSWAKSIGPVSE